MQKTLVATNSKVFSHFPGHLQGIIRDSKAGGCNHSISFREISLGLCPFVMLVAVTISPVRY